MQNGQLVIRNVELPARLQDKKTLVEARNQALSRETPERQEPAAQQ